MTDPDDDEGPKIRLSRRAVDAVTDNVSRRDVLVAGLVTVAVAGAGSVVGALDPWQPETGHPQPPRQLIDALAAERLLIARIDRSIAVNPALKKPLAGVRADHVAHAAAIENALSTFPGYVVPAPSSKVPPAAPQSGLRAAEQAAATRAAAQATTLAGTNAVLLASIAACEASHAEALS